MDDHVVDARWLEPPEPMELALAALNELQSGQRMLLLIHRVPYPLFGILQEWGYAYDMQERDDGTYEIAIWLKQPTAPPNGPATP